MRAVGGGTLFVCGNREGRGRGPSLVLGHRGASARATENTAEAFAQARADGADGVELDVMLCASGEPVVFHDDDLRRLAGRPERIAALPYRLLREVRLAPGGAIPTLEEAFAACGPDLLVNVELKVERGRSARDGGAGRCGGVRRPPAGGRVRGCWCRPSTRGPCGSGRGASPRCPSACSSNATRCCRCAGPGWRRPFARWRYTPSWCCARPQRVAGWKRRGYMVNVWTVDDPAALAACRRMGIDAVITNDPARSRAALDAA